MFTAISRFGCTRVSTKMHRFMPKMSSSVLDSTTLQARLDNKHINNNIPTSIIEKVGRNLHLQANHPLRIIKDRRVLNLL